MNNFPKFSSLVVISTEEQYVAAKKAGLALDEMHILCDNPRTFSLLKEHGVDFEIIGEHLLSEGEQSTINAWGMDRAAAWIRISNEKNVFSRFDFASAIYLRFSYLLVYMLKNYSLAKWAVCSFKPTTLYVFNYKESPSFPELSGNYWMNIFLSNMGRKKGIKVVTLDIKGIRDEVLSGVLRKSDKLRLFLKRNVKRLVQKVFIMLTVRSNKVSVGVSGNLVHLKPIIKGFYDRNIKSVLIDKTFQFKHWKTALLYRTPYVVLGELGVDNKSYVDNFIGLSSSEINRGLSLAHEKGLFEYQSESFMWFINKYLFYNVETYLKSMAEVAYSIDEICKRFHLKLLVLDEDTTPDKGFWAAYVGKLGVKVCVVSHGIFPVMLPVFEKNRSFNLSTTFVNSAYERDLYMMRGWHEKGLVVTGAPRYDRLRTIAEKKRGLKSSNTILFCGAALSESWPDRLGYLGIHEGNSGVFQKRALRWLLKSVKGKRHFICIKPHNFEGSAWKRFVMKHATSREFRVVDHREDFFSLLQSVNLMVVVRWSNAIFEAAISGVPVIVVEPCRKTDLAPYEKIGAVVVVHSERELQEALEAHDRLRNAVMHDSGFLGPSDKRNAERVVNYIASNVLGAQQ